MVSRRSFIQYTSLAGMAAGLGRFAGYFTLDEGTYADEHDPSSLRNGFIDPPDSVRPWVYWFWVNGNISKEGITKDLEAMKRVGIGGVLLMEVSHGAPVGPYAFGSAEWLKLFEFMLSEADRLGLKVNVNNDAGWSGSGGPWVTVDQSMQQVVWTEISVQGTKNFRGTLPQPAAVDNYYRDIKVLAFPAPKGSRKRIADYHPVVKSSDQNTDFDGQKLIDNNFRSRIELPKPETDHPQYIEFIFPTPVTSHAMIIHLEWPGWPPGYIEGIFQIADDDAHFKTIKEFAGSAPSISFEYDELAARRYRLTFTAWFQNKETAKQLPEKLAITEVELPDTQVKNIMQKALFRFPGNTIALPAGFQSVPPGYAVQRDQVLDITDKMQPDGSITWQVPEGEWTIMRIGHTTTGEYNHPAPVSGLGYECDKLSKDASTAFFNGLIRKLAEKAGSLSGKVFVSTHIDSWEAGAQNWTPGFLDEFSKRRGYDPVPYLPVMTGKIIDTMEVSERFLWDFRTTISEMMLENYAGNICSLAHQHGLRLSVEAYPVCLSDQMTYAGRADEPMAEFWWYLNSQGDAGPYCREMSSSAHVYGKKIVGAEAFTANQEEKWLGHPGNIKILGDWAFCEGVNRFVIHRYAMQPYENIKPGISVGPYGLHYERTQTWWEWSLPWHQYLARCQYLLQQGIPVADICYLAPEATPQGWQAPGKRDNATYNFDGCPPEAALTRMSVKDGRIMLPDGMCYHVLVLPSTETMTLGLLKKIKALVEAGATVIGAPPEKALGLSGYPQCDEAVKRLAAALWGKCDGKMVKENRVGKGHIVWGKTPEAVLEEMKISQDFSSGQRLRYTHRDINGTAIYFVANPAQTRVTTTCRFRVQGMQPEIWDPVTGEIREAVQFEETDSTLSMPLTLEPAGSVFVVFRPENKRKIAVSKLICNRQQIKDVTISRNSQQGFEMDLMQPGAYNLITADGRNCSFQVKNIAQPVTITGSWQVRFTDGMGTPDTTTFETLISWSDHEEESIKYYSGTAVYTKDIIIPADLIGKNKKLKLDLGKVEIMAAVRVNGKPLGIRWKMPYCIDITDAVKTGNNTIEIKVVNLWVNRMIGDEQLPDPSKRSGDRINMPWWPSGTLLSWPEWVTEGKPDPSGRYTFTTWKLWKKDSPLAASGLLGPVSIVSEEHITLDADKLTS